MVLWRKINKTNHFRVRLVTLLGRNSMFSARMKYTRASYCEIVSQESQDASHFPTAILQSTHRDSNPSLLSSIQYRCQHGF